MKNRCNKSTYNVGDKLISEIASVKDDYAIMTDGRCLSNAEMDKLDKLDSDYINDYFGELWDEAYNQGLKDAWELAKKMVAPAYVGGMGSEECIAVFGMNLNGYEVLSQYTPQEALTKLKAYEETKEFKVGDVVIPKEGYYNSGKAGFVLPISRARAEYPICVIHEEEGRFEYTYYKKESLEKTGKHINLEQILKEVGE